VVPLVVEAADRKRCQENVAGGTENLTQRRGCSWQGGNLLCLLECLQRNPAMCPGIAREAAIAGTAPVFRGGHGIVADGYTHKQSVPGMNCAATDRSSLDKTGILAIMEIRGQK
jgi:hypothetical protein